MGAYNASVKVSRGGVYGSVYVAEVDANGKMLRSNAVQLTRFDGTELYHKYMEIYHETHGETFEVLADNCQAYKDKIRGLSIPTSYTG